MGRTGYLIGLGAAFLAGSLVPCVDAREADRDYLAAPIVHEHEAPDPQNRFFELVYRSKSEDDDSATIPRVGILTGRDAPMAEWLSAHDGQRIAVTFRAGGPFTRDGLELGAQSRAERGGGVHVSGFGPWLRAEVTR